MFNSFRQDFRQLLQHNFVNEAPRHFLLASNYETEVKPMLRRIANGEVKNDNDFYPIVTRDMSNISQNYRNRISHYNPRVMDLNIIRAIHKFDEICARSQRDGIESISLPGVREQTSYDAFSSYFYGQGRKDNKGLLAFIATLALDLEKFVDGDLPHSNFIQDLHELLQDSKEVTTSTSRKALIERNSKDIDFSRNSTPRREQVHLTKHQIAAILACAFFDCLPTNQAWTRHRKGKSLSFRGWNEDTRGGGGRGVNKLLCLLNYFRRIHELSYSSNSNASTSTCKKVEENSSPDLVLNHLVSFIRCKVDMKYTDDLREYIKQHDESVTLPPNSGKSTISTEKSTKVMKDVIMHERKAIESATDCIQADFANKYIGGGVLGNGCVQEEIRFVISPECLVSLLLCEVMGDNESIYIVGANQFSSYRGYADTFEFVGNHVDIQKLDSISIPHLNQEQQKGRKENVFPSSSSSSSLPFSSTPSRSLRYYLRPHVAIYGFDAINFRHTGEYKQYEWSYVNRELIKCLSGLLINPFEGSNEAYCHDDHPFATGNWGCGAFGGDVELKFIIQWLASSLSSKVMIYSSFGDRRLSLDTVNRLLVQQKNHPNLLTPSFFYQGICDYGTQMKHRRGYHRQEEGLLNFLLNRAQRIVLEERSQLTSVARLIEEQEEEQKEREEREEDDGDEEKKENDHRREHTDYHFVVRHHTQYKGRP